MNAFYKKNNIDVGVIQGGEGVDFLQLGRAPFMTGPEPEFAVGNDTAPEFKLSHKGHRKTEGKGVLSLLQLIIQDLGDEITNAIAEENAAQKEFERLKGLAEKYQKEMETKEKELKKTIARLKKDKSDEEKLKKDNEAALKD